MSSFRVIGYSRCSSQEQARDGLSLEAQRRRLVAWTDATGADLIDLLEDAGVGGSRPLADRPAGSEIARLVNQRRPPVDAIAVVRLDRLGRDAAETLAYLRRFAKGPLGLVSIADRVDLATPQGRAMAGVGAIFSQLERELIGQRTSEALAALRGQGRLYGPVPFGFQAVDGALIAAPDEQVVIRRIIRLRSRGLSYGRIAELLNRDNVPAKRGGVWFPASVRSVAMTSSQVAEGVAA